MSAQKPMEVGSFVRFVGSHKRTSECGTIVAVNDDIVRFRFHFDGLEIERHITDFSSDVLVFWGI